MGIRRRHEPHDQSAMVSHSSFSFRSRRFQIFSVICWTTFAPTDVNVRVRVRVHTESPLVTEWSLRNPTQTYKKKRDCGPQSGNAAIARRSSCPPIM